MYRWWPMLLLPKDYQKTNSTNYPWLLNHHLTNPTPGSQCNVCVMHIFSHLSPVPTYHYLNLHLFDSNHFLCQHKYFCRHCDIHVSLFVCVFTTNYKLCNEDLVYNHDSYCVTVLFIFVFVLCDYFYHWYRLWINYYFLTIKT